MIYLDHAATSPLSSEALLAMEQVLRTNYGNPSSMHQAGRMARNELTRSRELLARLLGAGTRDLYFTSGATEANNWAIRAAATLAGEQGRRHLVTTSIEHPSVLAVFEALEHEGFDVTYLPADGDGVISLDVFEAALRADTGFVSIHATNNEIGSIQPIDELAGICDERDILFHTDAVQAIAQHRINWREHPADFLTLSAHKFGGPKGTGLLLARSERGPRAKELAPLILGGRQERGRRAGTENLAGIAGMAAALEAAYARLAEAPLHYDDLSQVFREALAAEAIDYRVHGAVGDASRHQASILNLYFPDIEGQTLLLLLDRQGLAVSLGSACEAGSSEASHVLLALGLAEDEASSSIRVSFGPETTEESVREAARIIGEAVRSVYARHRR